MNEKALKQASVETNTVYLMSLAMDLILRNNEWLMAKNREAFKREKKQVFTRYTKAVRDACYLQDMLTQDIFDVDEKNDFKNIQIWQEEANELARHFAQLQKVKLMKEAVEGKVIDAGLFATYYTPIELTIPGQRVKIIIVEEDKQ